MRIKYETGDMFAGPHRTIIHGCNAQGRMGSGVAKIVREQFPEAYAAYIAAYKSAGRLDLGAVIWAESNGCLIGNAITQDHYGNDGLRYVDYEAVRDAMKVVNARFAPAGGAVLTDIYDVVTDVHVAMPLIGAGLGGGHWPTIAAIIEAESTNFQPVVYTLDGKIPV